jgi:hypothetical protein
MPRRGEEEEEEGAPEQRREPEQPLGRPALATPKASPAMAKARAAKAVRRQAGQPRQLDRPAQREPPPLEFRLRRVERRGPRG